jgi:hypothetical protein
VQEASISALWIFSMAHALACSDLYIHFDTAPISMSDGACNSITDMIAIGWQGEFTRLNEA